MREKQLKILNRQYQLLLAKLKEKQSDSTFEKWLKLSQILKDRIIACENRINES